MHRSRLRTASIACSLAVVAAGLATAFPAARASDPTPALRRSVPSLATAVVRYALSAEGRTVRRLPGVRVEAIPLPTALDALVGSAVYRVRIDGRFPPRAERSVVLAGGRPVAWGIPTPSGRGLRAVTTDPAVLSAPLVARTGAAPSPTPTGTAVVPSGPGAAPGLLVGSHEVVHTAYDFGDRAWQPPGLGARVELRADVYHPADLEAGPYPLVLFLHGNHVTCYRGERVDYRWPCREGWTPIPNHEGYAYLARRLASWGFIVASVSGNGVNVHGGLLEDTGMRQRGELLEKHVDLWSTWTSTGGAPFGARFVGAVDLDRIGVMGHSRGGEGAVWQVLVDRERPDPYGLDAVLAIAPVDFTRAVLTDVPLGVILPTCDGDVSDLQGVRFFDDARYASPGDPAPKATLTVVGANHNFFNTVWSPSSRVPGAFDDGICRRRLSEPQQRRVAIGYVVSFFRRYVGGTPRAGEIWTGERVPAGIDPSWVLVSHLAPDDPSRRLDVERFTDPGGLGTNALGGAVRPAAMGLYGWCSNLYTMPCVPWPYTYQDIHASAPWFGAVDRGLAEAVFGWSAAAEGQAAVTFELPGGVDVRDYDWFSFRAVPNPSYDANLGIELQDLVVIVEDGDGDTAAVAAADVGNDALRFPVSPRGRGHVIMNQVRFPLSAFDGVDRSSITSVTLAFSRTQAGVINVADVAFWGGR
jgi:hypothetical protein